MKIAFHCDTNPGKVRGTNEDALLVLPDERLFVVADGLGGHAGGEIASHMAVRKIRDFFRLTAADMEATWPTIASEVEDDSCRRLVSAIQFAHSAVQEEGSASVERQGMSTTVVAAWFQGGRAYVAHVGDSRCYKSSGGVLTRLTRDHTLVNEMREDGTLTTESPKVLEALRHVLSRAVGSGSTRRVVVDLSVVDAKPGDVFLLCSDGLTLDVSDEELRDVLAEEEIPEETVRTLMALALSRTGRDNVTAVLVKVLPDDGVGDVAPDTMELPPD